MNQSEKIDRVIAALMKVPEKKLLIIELANRVPVVNGHLDFDALAGMQPEINLATAEAKSYGAHTMMAVDSLIRLRPTAGEV